MLLNFFSASTDNVKVPNVPFPTKMKQKTAKRPLPNKSNESISSQTSPSQQIQGKVL